MSTATQPRQPVAGPQFRKVAALRIDGTKRRKLLGLLAAYTDCGRPAPPVQELADRLDFRLPTTLGLLRRLERDGYLIATKRGGGRRARTRYRLRLPEDPPPAAPIAHDADTQSARPANANPCPTRHVRTHPAPEKNGQTLTRDKTP